MNATKNMNLKLALHRVALSEYVDSVEVKRLCTQAEIRIIELESQIEKYKTGLKEIHDLPSEHDLLHNAVSKNMHDIAETYIGYDYSGMGF